MATLATIISLRVSVPVLSEQMTETAPIVSIAGRRRTMALRLAIDCTPTASVIVNTAGNPAGIAATASPTMAIKSSSKTCSVTKSP